MLDAGWAEVCALGDGVVVARGHLLIDGLPAASDQWHGHLESARFPHGERALVPGPYDLRFVDGLQAIRVRAVIEADQLRVDGEDGELPPTLRELSDGE